MSQRTPYRELALVPKVVEPAPLVPFIKMNNFGPCPKCGTDRDPHVRRHGGPLKIIGRGVCTGRRFGLCRAGCNETREHFHVDCIVCGWRGLMATADAT